jgi:hypothetical protein
VALIDGRPAIGLTARVLAGAGSSAGRGSVREITEIYGLKAGTIFVPGDPTVTDTVIVARKRRATRV